MACCNSSNESKYSFSGFWLCMHAVAYFLFPRIRNKCRGPPTPYRHWKVVPPARSMSNKCDNKAMLLWFKECMQIRMGKCALFTRWRKMIFVVIAVNLGIYLAALLMDAINSSETRSICRPFQRVVDRTWTFVGALMVSTSCLVASIRCLAVMF